MKIISVFILLSLCVEASAQTNTFPGNGNVGIGTLAADQKLTIKGGGIGFDHNSTDKKLYSPVDGTLEWMTHNSAGEHGFAISHQGTRSIYLNTNGTSYINGGSLGIGTITPGNYKLNVFGPLSSGVNDYTYNSATFQLTNESKVDGISGISPTGAFRWYTNPNNSYRAGFLYQLRVYDSVNGEGGNLLTINGAGNIGVGYDPPAISSPDKLYVNGNVGIGTVDTKGYMLAVAGNMIAESVKVKLQGAWPDFVFAKSYTLPTLQETENHIKRKGHLPGIPSAEEVKEKGIDLGDMNGKLLQKIEELTLYIIDLEKRVKSIENKN